jgi:stage II sporulation protein D
MRPRVLRVMFVLLLASCARRAPVTDVALAGPDPVATGVPAGAPLDAFVDRTVWVRLGTHSTGVMPLAALADFVVLAEGVSPDTVARGTARDTLLLEPLGQALRVVTARGERRRWHRGALVMRANGGVRYAGTTYRGELHLTATPTGVLVVNRVGVEAYLRGVVPLEIGTRLARDSAAIAAQAIAARSYTYSRVPAEPRAPVGGYHVTNTVQHQVYGGMAAEHPVVDAAIAGTRGLALLHDGRVADAPYHASCGGQTATPAEAWRGGSVRPYLASVSDTNPATGAPYCDLSPRNRWTASFDEQLLRKAIARHLGEASLPVVRGVAIGGRSVSGRVETLVFRTDRGTVTVTAPEIREALRDARDAILASTYFSLESPERRGNRVARVALAGRGHGHGVGMCQWGAIGRARAGQSTRDILAHYYTGTTVARAQ